MINIILVDDHNLIREGIRHLLEFNSEFKVIAEYENGQDCLDNIYNYDVDILILDINMPKMNGIELLSELRKNNIDVKVLMLTVYSEIEYLVKSMNIGVQGYLLKDSGFEEFKTAIYSIMDNQIYIQPKLIPAYNNYLIKKDNDDEIINSLTKREYEVLKIISLGGTNKDAADKLCVSERTIKNHVSNIFKKINVTDRTQAAVFAIKNNIISV